MKTQTYTKTQQLTYGALGVALVFICTAFINIRLPLAANGGLIHLGNVPLFIFALHYGRWNGALVGAVGMSLFDVVGGWFLWAPFTFVIVGLIGYAVGFICEKGLTITNYCVAMVVAVLIKTVGYYGAEGLIYSNWLLPLGSIPGNIIQILIAALIAFPLAKKIEKIR
ncbi:MAG TPA: ECF transporter S component [Candidatus Dorea intestinavium]|nr:ECF transporter S component [Candidatus Dorea intestinavium]